MKTSQNNVKEPSRAFKSLQEPSRAFKSLVASVLLVTPILAQESSDLPWEDRYWSFMDSFYPSPVLTDVLDSDNDGVSDVLETSLNLDPLDNQDASKDQDEDRLNVAEELFLGTSDLSVDTDEDGVTDWDEVFIYRTEPTFYNEDFQVAEDSAVALSSVDATASVVATSSNLIQGGDFNGYGDALNRGNDTWGIVGHDSWETDFEVQNKGGREYVELSGIKDGDGGFYTGLEQKVDLAPGSYILIWDHSPRNHRRSGTNAYSVDVQIAGATILEELYEHSWADKTVGWSQTALAFIVEPASEGDTSERETSIKFIRDASESQTNGVFLDDIMLVPLDLDIIHPATGELEEEKEDGANADAPDGGYVSVKRMIDDAQGGRQDTTPITKLKIHKVEGAESGLKTRLKFNTGGRYAIYKDEDRTELVSSEQDEFPANEETILYFHGDKKSESRGGEEITMQIGSDNKWSDGDSVKCTVIQSEFQIQVKAFISYGWTEAEEITGPELINPLNGKVVQGDLNFIGTTANVNARSAGSTFVNAYSDNTSDFFKQAPFRIMQTVVLTPYKELHDEADKEGERKVETAPLSEHYVKATGVDPTELHLEMGFKDLLAAGFDSSGKPPVSQEEFNNLTREAESSSITLEAAGKDGAIGSFLGIPVTWASADIHWKLDLKLLIGGIGSISPIQPAINYEGEHDSYPAYEIIALQSDGTFTDVHRRSPAAGVKPGPSSLYDGNSVPIAGITIITE